MKGCSCKQAEYNPTEIEAAGQKADAGTGTQQAAAPASPAPPEQLNVDGNAEGASGPPPAAEPAPAGDPAAIGGIPPEAAPLEAPQEAALPPPPQETNVIRSVPRQQGFR